MTSVSLTGEMESVVGDVRQPLRILFAAVGVLLLIACANAAGLFLTRSSNRIAELSIRAALGASRRVLARHLLIEALSLCVEAFAERDSQLWCCNRRPGSSRRIWFVPRPSP